ncbi:MAG: DUF4397 domain-containing protein [Burkholderiaceae bacterium]|nr:DUF4397 domain-containing protein [Burkholderiaceae bacterium]
MTRRFTGTLRALRAIALGAGVGLLLAACGGDDDEPNTRLRAVHASADAPAVDVAFAGQPIAQGAAFKQAGPFVSLIAGSAPLTVSVAGSGTGVLNETVTVAPERATTAVVVGSAAAGAPAGKRLAAVLVEDSGAPPTAGQVKVRVVHGAPDVPAVDIYVTAPAAALPPTPTVPALPYRGVAPASGAAALQVPAGEHRVRVTPAGQPGTIAFDSGAVTLPAGADLLLVAIPRPGGGVAPISLLAVPASGAAFEILDARAALRVGHFAPNVPAVDVFLKQPGQANAPANRVLTHVAFPVDSGFLSVPGGTYDAAVALTGSLSSVLELNGATLAKSTSTSVFAIGLLNGSGAQALRLAVFADDRTPVAGKAKVRVLHLAPDAPAVDVVVLAGGAIAARPVTNLAFPNATAAPLLLDPGSYTLGVVPAGQGSPILPSAAGVPVTLAAGDVLTVAALGCLNTGSGPCAGGAAFQFKVLDDR